MTDDDRVGFAIGIDLKGAALAPCALCHGFRVAARPPRCTARMFRDCFKHDIARKWRLTSFAAFRRGVLMRWLYAGLLTAAFLLAAPIMAANTAIGQTPAPAHTMEARVRAFVQAISTGDATQY